MKRLLVVVDFQNDFVKGNLSYEGAELLDDVIVEKIENYLDNGDEVVCTYDTHFEDYIETNEGKNLPIPHCIKGTEGWELFGKTGELLQNARSFEKYTFGSYELGDYILENQFEEIEFVGLVTNICIISNAVIAKAANPEATITIDSKAVGSYDRDLENKAFDIMENLHMTVIR